MVPQGRAAPAQQLDRRVQCTPVLYCRGIRDGNYTLIDKDTLIDGRGDARTKGRPGPCVPKPVRAGKCCCQKSRCCSHGWDANWVPRPRGLANSAPALTMLDQNPRWCLEGNAHHAGSDLHTTGSRTLQNWHRAAKHDVAWSSVVDGPGLLHQDRLQGGEGEGQG
jgi:hypothetical protein